MRYAVVDIGSNTVKINIFESDMSQVLYKSLPVGLISYIEHSIMTDAGIDKLIDTLREYKQIAEDNNVSEIYYIATASLRNINNQVALLDTVHVNTGIDIEIISSDDEAQYSFEGLKYFTGKQLSTGIMIDMGGGSTEILGFRDSKVCDIVSLPFGCLKLYTMFISGTLPDTAEINRIYDYVDKTLSDISWLPDYGNTVYLIGGTARSLEQFHLKINNYSDMLELLHQISNNLSLIQSTVPDRVTTIIPGLAAYCRIIYHKKPNQQHVVITQTGLREGCMMQKIINNKTKNPPT